MKRIILFSPNGYVGSFLKEGILQEKNFQLFELTRNNNLEQYKGNYDVLVYSAAVTSVRNETAEKYVQDNVVAAVRISAEIMALSELSIFLLMRYMEN